MKRTSQIQRPHANHDRFRQLTRGRVPCNSCQWYFPPYICNYCEHLVLIECKKCHSRNQHQGRRIKNMTICLHCGRPTPAPSYNQTRVFFLRVVFGKGVSAITEELNKNRSPGKPEISERFVRRWREDMIHLCSHEDCLRRLFPHEDEFRIFANRAMGMSMAEAAYKFNMTEYGIRKICDKSRDVYRLDYREIRSADALMRRLLRIENMVRYTSQEKLNAMLHPRRAKNPMHSRAHRRENPDGNGTGGEFAVRTGNKSSYLNPCPGDSKKIRT